MPETIYEEANRVGAGLAALLAKTGGSKSFQAPQLAHYPITDTGLAACLLTLGIPRREPGFFTDYLPVDENGNAGNPVKAWWVGDVSAEGGHKTEELQGAWMQRARFEAGWPLHPLVAMRDALDARAWWLEVIDAKRNRSPIFADIMPGNAYVTTSIREASILRACKFQPLAFTGHAFAIQKAKVGVAASKVVVEAEKPAGATPPQWMDRVIRNLSALLNHVKMHSRLIGQAIDGQTLILSEDATTKTRDKFFAEL